MNKSVILIIEDEPTINRIVASYFIKENYNVLTALNGKDGLKIFKENKVDLICLDIMMPEIDGWNVTKEIRKTSDVPIIIMSALSQEEDILKGYELKVNDYITKPFNPKILLAKIMNIIERSNLAESKQISGIINIDGTNLNIANYTEHRNLKDILTNDDLTGIANRRYIDFYLNNLISESREFSSSFGILFFDIDHFKNVNDNYGHLIGDEILKIVAKTLSNNLRIGDLVGRWGGEEFIIIMKVNNIKALEKIAEKLRILVSESSYRLENSDNLSVTVSIGGTMFEKGEDIASLVSRADSLMYKSKENGRNRVTIK